ncbi:hypothetical protein TL16_g00780 [Triparma laevis f. inornata]|uniref:Uncharacterized protein n=1 Tax=Triparma laevis f. inornata TaxID=1714386 RepID=A0A9W6ZE10_9STRA|nr:hypothetical protein TL16_g00780 [Triparma laevis f. inornata]
MVGFSEGTVDRQESSSFRETGLGAGGLEVGKDLARQTEENGQVGFQEGLIQRSESSNFRKTGIGAGGLGAMQAASAKVAVADHNHNDNHAKFSRDVEVVDDGKKRSYRKTGGSGLLGEPAFGRAYNMDNEEDEEEEDEDEEVQPSSERSSDQNHVFFEVQKTGGRRESAVSLKTDTSKTGPKRQFRKTGGDKLNFNLNMDVIDDDEEGEEGGNGGGDGGKVTQFQPGNGRESPGGQKTSALKSGMKSGMKQGGKKVVGVTPPDRGRGISFGNENETVDFDNSLSASDIAPAKRKFRKTGAMLHKDSPDVDIDLEAQMSSGSDVSDIQKKYVNNGISFSSYNMDDEDDDQKGPSDLPPPSDKLLNASPAFMEFKRTVLKRQDELEEKMKSRGGAKLGGWAGTAILMHVVMIVFTLLYVVDAVKIGDWMVVFLVFLVVTLANYMTTFNKNQVNSSASDLEKAGSGKSVVIEIEKQK